MTDTSTDSVQDVGDGGIIISGGTSSKTLPPAATVDNEHETTNDTCSLENDHMWMSSMQ